MRHRINIGMSHQSIQNAIAELKAYKKDLNSKCERFVKELADLGVNAAMTTLAFEGLGDAPRDADFDVKIDNDGRIIACVIRVTGEGILFWEFGAGNEFNGMNSPNPKAGAFGMGPGTYPGQTHVPIPGFWYYRDQSGESVRSYGTQATMPMYKASVEMITQIQQVAKRVFG